MHSERTFDKSKLCDMKEWAYFIYLSSNLHESSNINREERNGKTILSPSDLFIEVWFEC